MTKALLYGTTEMAPITAPTFAHTLDASIKQRAGDNLAEYFDLQDSHVLSLFQGLAPNDKYPENVRRSGLSSS